MVNMEDNEILNGEEYVDPTTNIHYGKGDSTRSFKDIIISQIATTIKNGSVDFQVGFWSKRLSKVGGEITESETYIQDSFEQYGNSVDSLHDLLLCFFTPTMIKKSKEHYDKLKLLKKKYSDHKNYRQYKQNYKRELLQSLLVFVQEQKIFNKKEITD